MEPVADFGIITCANDRMLPFLEAWFGAVRTFNRDVPLALLPFDDDVGDVRRLAERGSILFCDGVTDRWRQFGREIYRSAEYRPHIASADYLSKLAAFDGPFDRFLFLDCNSMIFFDAKSLCQRTSPDSIYFLYYALHLANYASEEVQNYYRSIDNKFHHGFNVNFFLASRNRVRLERALATGATADDLARLFGPTADQSFLSWYCVHFGIPCIRARDAGLAIRGWARADLNGTPEAPVNDRRQRVHHVKWNGPEFSPTLRNYWLLDHYRRLGQQMLG